VTSATPRLHRRSTVRIALLLLLTGLIAPVFVALAHSQTEALPQTQPQAARLVEAHWSSGVDRILAGRFGDGLAELNQAAELAPDDQRIAQAISLVENFLERRRLGIAEQSQEYHQAVEGVRRSMLAQEYLPVLAEANIETKLRDRVKAFFSALEPAGGESIAQAEAQEVGVIRAEALKALEEAEGQLAKALKRLATDESPYAQTFRQLAAKVFGLIEACRIKWESAELQTPAERAAAGEELADLSEELFEVAGQLKAMTAEHPWRIGLRYARLAAELATDKEEMRRQAWYQLLTADVQARARRAAEQGQWYDAMSAYVGLEALEPENEAYKAALKQAAKHVRVLRLYGPEEPQPGAQADGDGDEPPPIPAPDDREQPFWQELVEGVDARMVEKIISQLDGYYVSAIDYRKVNRGALTSIRILAETPEAAHSFPGLADDQQRQKFLKEIDRLLEANEARDRIDHLDLVLAMNSVLRASERTVRIPTEVLAVEFTEGLLGELDQFSSMIWPHDMDDFRKQTMGHFYGVGIQITKEPGEPLQVVTPLVGTPAFRAGIKAGDLILAVDGRATEDLSLDRLVRMITGEKNTKVVLRIERPGRPEPFDVTVIRDEITIETVKGWRRKPGGQWDYMLDKQAKIGYLRLSQFTDQTAPAVRRALTELRARGVRSLVLDLRHNPGGLLQTAAEVANEFLAAGRIVSTKGRQVPQSELNANASGCYLDGDLVVLTDGITASAAEILAGAIRDWNRGLIVGQRTFGKGSVQNVITIRRDRALLKLTTAYYYLPSGRLIHKRNGQKTWGVDPDIEVRLSPKQLGRWLDQRRESEVIQDVDSAGQEAQPATQLAEDTPLSAAVMLLRLMQLKERTGTALAVGAAG